MTPATLCRCRNLLVILAMLPLGAYAEERGGSPADIDQSMFEVRGLSAGPGEDDPRILYILPWQTPTLPRRPRTELNQQAPQLLQAVPQPVLENHRQFRETLNPLVLGPVPVARPATADDSQP
ncbi:hypothetical protein [Marinobacter sp. VGCF2001]|uniref:hypothetical protein n=1 Tax=Marinobacter sp. VGCF2001 TaxID=3417189 RepID=UPI003CF4089B